jgi:hypothetical protein
MLVRITAALGTSGRIVAIRIALRLCSDPLVLLDRGRFAGRCSGRFVFSRGIVVGAGRFFPAGRRFDIVSTGRLSGPVRGIGSFIGRNRGIPFFSVTIWTRRPGVAPREQEDGDDPESGSERQGETDLQPSG